MPAASAPSQLARTSGLALRGHWRPFRAGSFRCVALLVLATITASNAQEVRGTARDAANDAPTTEAPARPDCRDCHYCDNPTPAEPCLLNPCTRNGPEGVTPLWTEYEGPDVVILDELEDAYLPVPFDHRGHAEMAAMTTGCSTCHHYSPERQQHPECKTCHDVSSAGTDIEKPGLKGAYHQMCLSCHREWIDETACSVCHMRKAGRGAARATPPPTKDDILGLMHPPISEPDTEIFRGTSAAQTGTQVVFRHRKHVNTFALDCVNCHRESSCASCHRDAAEPQRLRTVLEHHQPCIHCHKHDMDLEARTAGKCERCHWRAGEPRPRSFDHASTGWALRPYHERLSCRACHPDVPFVRPRNDCDTCHDGWDPQTFDHGVTGQILNENHAKIGCELCHAELRFDGQPTCDECHDDEEDGVAFPTRRPGPKPGTAPAGVEESPDAAANP